MASDFSVPNLVLNATALRIDLLFFAIACVTFIASICSLLLARIRRDRLLLALGVFSLLYACRLFLEYDLVPAAIGVGRHQLTPWILCMTYVMPIPFALFAFELLGRGWKRIISIWLYSEVAFAVIAIPVALLTGRTYWSDKLNGVMVISGTALILIQVLLKRGASGSFANSLAWPLLVCAAFIVWTNSPFRPARFDPEPGGFLILLAGLGSAAARRTMANERKLVAVEHELATARRIQSSIIPASSPSLSGLKIATRYEPMTSVAGDFYDFVQAGEGCLSILVADVSGHGVPAALVASMLKVCFAAQRAQAHDPAAVLSGLNRMLRGSLGGHYVTAACAAIDLPAKMITYSGAGHPPSLLLRYDTGDVLRLAENGLFIGPFPDANYSNISVPVQDGDKLLLYTDGIIEAPGVGGEEFGHQRLEDFLRSSRALEPAEVISELFAEVSISAQQDDLTVVLAQFG